MMSDGIIPFAEWARGITPRGTPSRIPVKQNVKYLHHGATGVSSIATCRAYANYHIKHKKWLTIGYSFLIAEGKLLEGRGPGRQGAHTQGMNSGSYGILIAGNYSKRLPAERDLAALIRLLHIGVNEGWWDEPRLTGGHRSAPGATTSCPGDALYRHIPQINHLASVPTFEAASEDEMNDADRALLGDISTKLDIIIKAIGDRKGFTSVANDLGRLRRGQRALIEHDRGLEVPDGP